MMVIDHQAKLVQARVSEQADAALVNICNARGLSKAALVREILYSNLGLTLPKETP